MTTREVQKSKKAKKAAGLQFHLHQKSKKAAGLQ